jgi:FkbM family methyltransferase
MTAPVMDMPRPERRTLASRLSRFWRRPWHEKIFVLCDRIRMSFPGFPVPLRLPFGSWWVIRRGAIDGDIQAGKFETAELQFTQRFLQPGMTVLDIGANCGLYTLLASRCVGARGRVFAFEPSPRERKRLRTHLWLNRCTNARIVPYALGSRASQADLYVVQGAQTGCNSLRPPQVVEPVMRARVEIRALDDFLGTEKLSCVDFIKMDVEGGELEVLRGAAKLFQGPRLPVLLLEVSDLRTAAWNYKAKEILHFLQEHGYVFFSISSGGRLVPPSYSEDYLDTNLVALPQRACQAVVERLQGSSQDNVVGEEAH